VRCSQEPEGSVCAATGTNSKADVGNMYIVNELAVLGTLTYPCLLNI
jgi:hypothetical protein